MSDLLKTSLTLYLSVIVIYIPCTVRVSLIVKTLCFWLRNQTIWNFTMVTCGFDVVHTHCIFCSFTLDFFYCKCLTCHLVTLMNILLHATSGVIMMCEHYALGTQLHSDYPLVKKQPSQDVLHGDAAEELGLTCLVSSYTLLHQNSQPGGRGRQTARSRVLSRRARDTWSVTWHTSRLYSRFNKISHGGLWHYDRFYPLAGIAEGVAGIST